MPRRLRHAAALLAGLLLLLTPATAANAAATPAGPARELTVWLMWGSVPQPELERLTVEFEQTHPGVTVNVRMQGWPGIDERLEAALNSDEAPDVVETGTTTTPYFAARGLLKDLSDQSGPLGAQEWIPSLRESGNWQDRQYGVPLYAASRVVIYRKDLFEEAGLTPPRDQREWLRTTRALSRAHRAEPGFQPVYLPGQNWYVLSGFLHDRGGRIAQYDGARWRGGLSTRPAAEALEYYRALQSFSQAPKDQDEAHPFQYEVLAKGQVAQMIGLPWEVADAERINPELRGKLGMFPVPGTSADRPGSVFLGGSHLAVAGRARQPALAADWVALLTGPAFQQRLATANGVLPNRLALAQAIDDPGVRVQAQAAANGHTTPVDPRWPTVEAAPNPLKTLLTDVLTGRSPRAAGHRADTVLEERLNAAAPPAGNTTPQSTHP
ncbi:carbohydrate ABC transporter substrate-binding protein (CUT1 family) [Streptomyces sp. Ag109_G2-6]|uniref:extracellular solute-binding protein n=1 Tax=Streptomyces sp. Ag109_G2-6 TaxID=2485154 RepID=UPI000F4F1F4F|nr:extracellular solute-binding protein [Streptomyces sp. Ag109_G2-6]RPF29972.1 carbohydrate ABC transporter substrate-binding protein (CUT1 family) [Streptomyces sp. Ag109_G2-6]